MFFKNSRYKFNPDTLSYDKIFLSTSQKFVKVLFIATLVSVLLATISYSIHTLVFYDNNTREVERENKLLRTQFSKLTAELNQAHIAIDKISSRDENLYRVLLNAKPNFKRLGGTGGSKKIKLNIRDYRVVGKNVDRLENLKAKIQIQESSFDELMSKAITHKDELTHMPALSPVSNKNSHISSGFGYRLHPILRRRKMHDGVDFSAKRGTKIYSPGDGVVLETKYAGGYGRQITIDHGFGYVTKCAHLQSFDVRPGQKIKRGQVIGRVGNTGLSTAPHLHYEVIKDGKKINPSQFFFFDFTPENYNLLSKK